MSYPTPTVKYVALHITTSFKYNIIQGRPASLRTSQRVFSNLPDFNLKLDLHDIPKSSSLDIELQQAAYRTIHSRYPEYEWIHVYTDGSSYPGVGNTGAGYYCKYFEGYCAVGAPLSNFDGEVRAVLEALIKLKNIKSHKKAVLLVDSQSTITSLSRNCDTDSQLVIECRSALANLGEDGWLIEFQWIPSHVQIHGNEKADHLAKMGAHLPQPSALTCLSSAKSQINLAVHKWHEIKQKEAAKGKKWECLAKRSPVHCDLPRAVGVAAFRALTGHDLLAAHLCRIGIYQDSSCPLCNHHNMDSEHLRCCPGLAEARRSCCLSGPYLLSHLYWSARRLMAEMPRVGVG